MILRWAIVLGVAGFLAGFIGPMILSDGNQGPMFGLFFSGPGGAVFGAVLGVLAQILGLSARANNRAMVVAASALALATLWGSIPPPRPVAELVDGDIRSCASAQSLKGATVVRLSAQEAKRPDRTSTRWDDRFDQALAQTAGVVVEMQLRRTRRILQADAPWNRGALRAESWTASTQRSSYLVERGDCANLAPGTPARFAVKGALGIWPPYDLAQMLDVKIARPVPTELGIFLTDTKPD